MASPTDTAPSSGDSSSAGLEPAGGATRGRQPSRLNQALAWVGIVAGGLFIVAAIFFSGFFLSWTTGGQGGHHSAPKPMACCPDMKPGEKMGPAGQMAPDGMMPGGMMRPSPQPPATTVPGAPRP
jgi:hypothetical protein